MVIRYTWLLSNTIHRRFLEDRLDRQMLLLQEQGELLRLIAGERQATLQHPVTQY